MGIKRELETLGVRYSLVHNTVMALAGYQANNNVVYSSKYHVSLDAKISSPLVVGAIAQRSERVIGRVGAKYRAEIMALEIMPDPVHLLCEIDPQLGNTPTR